MGIFIGIVFDMRMNGRLNMIKKSIVSIVVQAVEVNLKPDLLSNNGWMGGHERSNHSRVWAYPSI